MRPIRLLIGSSLSSFQSRELVSDGRRSGIEVVAEVHDGQEVLRKAAELHPEAVLVDTDLAGLELLGLTAEVGRSQADARAVLFCLHAPTRREAEQSVLATACAYVLNRAEIDDVEHLIQNVHATSCSHMETEAAASLVKETLDHLLTKREYEVLSLIAQAKTTREIAGLLEIAPRTVDAHRSNIMKKLDIHRTAALVRYAIRHGIGGKDST